MPEPGSSRPGVGCRGLEWAQGPWGSGPEQSLHPLGLVLSGQVGLCPNKHVFPPSLSRSSGLGEPREGEGQP